MEEHPNVALIRRSFELFDSGDWEALHDLGSPDIVWHQIGGPTLNGTDELMASMGGFGDADLHMELHDIVGNDDHVVALVSAHVTAGDLEITYRVAEIYHVVDGKITERWAMSDDTAAITKFFGQLAAENA